MREYMYKCCTAQPRHTVPKGQTFAGGLGPLACGHCSAARAGSPLEGRGGGGDRQTPLPRCHSHHPGYSWIIKISGLRTSDFLWFPTWETQSQATPQNSRPRGLHQGMMRLGKEWWPEERMVLKNVEVSYTGKRTENLLPCLSHPPKDWATVESLGGNWNFSEKWGVGSTLSGLSQPAARHVLSTFPTRWCYLSW